MRILQQILLIVFLFVSPHIVADTKELFTAVDPDKAQELTKYNDIFLKENLYFASRHRIVQVDTRLLNSNGEFTITPFGDVQILVKTKVIIPNQGFRTTWNGEILPPPWFEVATSQATDSYGADLSVEDIEELRSSLTAITFYIQSWDEDRRTGAVVRSSQREMGFSRQINDIPDIPDLERNAFRSVNGKFTTLFPRKQYVLWPLKYTPKYHVIYEIDDSKDYTKSTDPKEARRKLNVHEKYLKNLPKENPGKAIKGEL